MATPCPTTADPSGLWVARQSRHQSCGIRAADQNTKRPKHHIRHVGEPADDEKLHELDGPTDQESGQHQANAV